MTDHPTRDLIIGLDAGTSVIKAVVFDLSGRQLAASGTRNLYHRSADGLAVEQDLNLLWRHAAQVLAALHDQIPDLKSRVIALGVTGQGDGTCLIGPDGEPTAPAWLWLDSRSSTIVQEFADSGRREAIFQRTGCGMNGSNQSGHLLWLDRHHPDILDRSAYACHFKDWLYFKLTGQRCTDVSEACFTFGNFRTRHYDEEVITLFGLQHRRHLLPPIVDSQQGDYHPLTAAAAEQIGLNAGLPVILGYVDVVCTALAAGLADPEPAAGVSILGSTGMHIRFEPQAAAIIPGRDAGGYVMLLGPGTAARTQSNMAASINIDWLIDLATEANALVGHQTNRAEVLAAFESAVAAEAPGQALYHPYIDPAGERGPFVNPHARAQFIGLSNRIGFAGLVRSVYEGLALAARDCYAAMGGPPAEVRLAGGAARSTVLKSIFASVLGVPVREAKRDEAGAAGVMMMSLVTLGLTDDLVSASRTVVSPTLGRLFAPDPALGPLYDGLYQIYRQQRDSLPPVWHRLAALRAAAPLERNHP